MKSIKELSDLSGRSVVITGGAGHIGMVAAKALYELGASVILLDKVPPSNTSIKEITQKVQSTGSIHFIGCDIENEHSRTHAIKKIHEDLSHLSCLINNAAFVGTSDIDGWSTTFENQLLDAWKRALEVNLTACFHFSRDLTGLLKKGAGPNIINITSIYAQYGPDWRLYDGTKMANPAAYAASKGGLNQLTRWLSTTLSPEIRVNGIAPGGIYRNQPKIFVDRYESMCPLGRMGTEEDLVGALMYLSTDLSRYVTGHILPVDGGWGVW